MNKKISLIVFLCLSCLAPPSVRAQASESPELIQLRTATAQQIQTATVPAEAAFLTALETLKQQFARNNKIDEAVSVDNDIKRIKHEPTSPTKAPADPPELLARRADHYRAVCRLQIQPLTAYLRALEPLKQQLRRNGQLEAIVAVDNEIKSATDKLKAAQTGSSLSSIPPPVLQIESATFGDPKTKRMQDATAAIRAVYDSGAPTIVLGGRDLHTGDPAPGVRKMAIITYKLNGVQKQKTFMADVVLNFKGDLR